MVNIGALIRTVDPRDLIDPSTSPLYLPDLQVNVFFQSNAAAVLPNISKMMRKETKHKLVSQWAQQHDPLLKHIHHVCQAYPALRAIKLIASNRPLQDDQAVNAHTIMAPAPRVP
jgi:hypothetical protein